jgi:hypothetical protein
VSPFNVNTHGQHIVVEFIHPSTTVFFIVIKSACQAGHLTTKAGDQHVLPLLHVQQLPSQLQELRITVTKLVDGRRLFVHSFAQSIYTCLQLFQEVCPCQHVFLSRFCKRAQAAA